LCQRVCLYDAISYAAEKTKHVIEKTKCTYPKCTLCVDECLQDAIDFSKDPPVNYNRCEGCDLCWCICPENAVSIPNVAEVHLKKGWWARNAFAGMTGGGGATSHPDARSMTPRMPRFRQLIPTEEIGVKGQVMFNTHAPRVVLNKADWPYHIDEG